METAFFRPSEEKCPNCGDFGRSADGAEHRVCPACNTRFNDYVVLHEGRDVPFQNN